MVCNRLLVPHQHLPCFNERVMRVSSQGKPVAFLKEQAGADQAMLTEAFVSICTNPRCAY